MLEFCWCSCFVKNNTLTVSPQVCQLMLSWQTCRLHCWQNCGQFSQRLMLFEITTWIGSQHKDDNLADWVRMTKLRHKLKAKLSLLTTLRIEWSWQTSGRADKFWSENIECCTDEIVNKNATTNVLINLKVGLSHYLKSGCLYTPWYKVSMCVPICNGNIFCVMLTTKPGGIS